MTTRMREVFLDRRRCPSRRHGDGLTSTWRPRRVEMARELGRASCGARHRLCRGDGLGPPRRRRRRQARDRRRRRPGSDRAGAAAVRCDRPEDLQCRGRSRAAANVAKIAGNLMVACAIEAIAEAAALVRGHGMSAPDVLDAIITSLFNVPVYRGYGDMIGKRQYEPPGFDLVLGLKDVRLALEAGEEVRRAAAVCERAARHLPRRHRQRRRRQGLVGHCAGRGAQGRAAATEHISKTACPTGSDRCHRSREADVRLRTRCDACAQRAAVVAAGDACVIGADRRRAGGRSDQDRLFDAADRQPRLDRQGDPHRLSDVGAGHQRQGRAARPPGPARLLRRPEQSVAWCPASMPSCSTSTRSTSCCRATAPI